MFDEIDIEYKGGYIYKTFDNRYRASIKGYTNEFSTMRLAKYFITRILTLN